MKHLACRFCGATRKRDAKPCWCCGELNESWLAAVRRHFPRLAAIGRDAQRLLRAAR